MQNKSLTQYEDFLRVLPPNQLDNYQGEHIYRTVMQFLRPNPFIQFRMEFIQRGRYIGTISVQQNYWIPVREIKVQLAQSLPENLTSVYVVRSQAEACKLYNQCFFELHRLSNYVDLDKYFPYEEDPFVGDAILEEMPNDKR